MHRFEQGDVVRVPFPYSDREARQHRPALVVSKTPLGDGGSVLWVVMITSAANRGWPGDVPLVENFQAIGLPIPSLVRTSKIATIEVRHAKPLGRLPPPVWSAVAAALKRNLGF